MTKVSDKTKDKLDKRAAALRANLKRRKPISKKDKQEQEEKTEK